MKILNSSEFEQMKKEANKKAKEYSSRSVPEKEREDGAESSDEKNDVQKPEEKKADKSFLSALLKDKDRTIILALILLLMGDEDNYELLMTLFYLLM